MTRNLLGQLLVRDGEITEQQLEKALQIQKRDGGLIGIILKKLGYISEEKLIKYLTIQTNHRVQETRNMKAPDSM